MEPTLDTQPQPTPENRPEALTGAEAGKVARDVLTVLRAVETPATSSLQLTDTFFGEPGELRLAPYDYKADLEGPTMKFRGSGEITRAGDEFVNTIGRSRQATSAADAEAALMQGFVDFKDKWPKNGTMISTQRILKAEDAAQKQVQLALVDQLTEVSRTATDYRLPRLPEFAAQARALINHETGADLAGDVRGWLGDWAIQPDTAPLSRYAKRLLDPAKTVHIMAYQLDQQNQRLAAGEEKERKRLDNALIDAAPRVDELEAAAAATGYDKDAFYADFGKEIAGHLSINHADFGPVLRRVIDSTPGAEAKQEVLREAQRSLVEERRQSGQDQGLRTMQTFGRISYEPERLSKSFVAHGALLDIAREQITDAEELRRFSLASCRDVVDEIALIGGDREFHDVDPSMVRPFYEAAQLTEKMVTIPGYEDLGRDSTKGDRLDTTMLLIGLATTLSTTNEHSDPDHVAFASAVKAADALIMPVDHTGHVTPDAAAEVTDALVAINGLSNDMYRQLGNIRMADMLVYQQQQGAEGIDELVASIGDARLTEDVDRLQGYAEAMKNEQTELFAAIHAAEAEATAEYILKKTETASVTTEDVDAETARIAGQLKVSINISPDALMGVLDSQRFKSTWEVESRSGKYAIVRHYVEQSKGWRVPVASLTSPEPIYGAVMSPNGRDEVMGAAPGGYGGIFVELDNEAVAGRTIVTPEDSFHGATRDYSATLEAAAPFVAVQNLTNGHYVEAQIFGGVRMEEIKAVNIPAELADPAYINRLRQFLPQARIKVVTPGQRQAAAGPKLNFKNLS